MFKTAQKEFKLFCLIFVFIFSFLFFSFLVKAEEDTLLPEEQRLEVATDTTEEVNYINDENEVSNQNVLRKKINYRKKNLQVSDRAFLSDKEVTFKDLLIKVFSIVLFLLGILFITKICLSRYKFDKPGSFLDNLAHKLQDTFAPTVGVKLKQTLILTPGQNLYLVEIDEKKLLLGGTHQGGIQFLADLTHTKKSEVIDYKKADEYQVYAKQVNPAISSKPIENPFVTINQNGQMESNPAGVFNYQEASSSEKELSPGIAQIKQTLKRRTNFRQTLLNNK